MSVGPARTIVALLALTLPSTAVASDEPFHDPTIKVTVGSSAFVSARFDSVLLKLADGSLFVQGNRSTDGGTTWTLPPGAVRTSFFDRWRQTAGCVLRDGTYIGLGSRMEFPTLHTRILKVYRSDDNLKTIAGPSNAVLDFPQGTGGYTEAGQYIGGTALEHSLIEREDGTLIGCAYGWWKGDEEYSMPEKYVPESGQYKYRTWVIASEDHGKTWQTLGSPGYWPELGPEGMCEPGLTVLANGDLFMLMRNGEWGEPIFQTRSGDGGKTWSKPEKLPAIGVWPTPCLMSNGLLVAAVGRPDCHLWISPDGRGNTWTSRTVITTEPVKGYASVVKVEPDKLIFSGLNKKKRALEIWPIRVERIGHSLTQQ